MLPSVPFLDLYGPVDMPHQDMSVLKGVGYAIVDWPSGRQTAEIYAAVQTTTGMERARAGRSVMGMQQEKLYNLLNSAADFRKKAEQHLMWVRVKKGGKRKARYVAAITWIKGSEFKGPWPKQYGG